MRNCFKLAIADTSMEVSDDFSNKTGGSSKDDILIKRETGFKADNEGYLNINHKRGSSYGSMSPRSTFKLPSPDETSHLKP
jgi:hypothetical protein